MPVFIPEINLLFAIAKPASVIGGSTGRSQQTKLPNHQSRNPPHYNMFL